MGWIKNAVVWNTDDFCLQLEDLTLLSEHNSREFLILRFVFFIYSVTPCCSDKKNYQVTGLNDWQYAVSHSVMRSQQTSVRGYLVFQRSELFSYIYKEFPYMCVCVYIYIYIFFFAHFVICSYRPEKCVTPLLEMRWPKHPVHPVSHEREREYDCVNAARSWGCISSWLGVYTRTWKKWEQFVLYQCTAAFCLLENECCPMFMLLLWLVVLYQKCVALVNMVMNIRLNNRANRVIANFLWSAVPHGINCIEVCLTQNLWYRTTNNNNNMNIWLFLFRG